MLFSLFNFPLVLDEGTACTARRSDAVRCNVTFHVVCFSGSAMLDSREEPCGQGQYIEQPQNKKDSAYARDLLRTLASTEKCHASTRPIALLIP